MKIKEFSLAAGLPRILEVLPVDTLADLEPEEPQTQFGRTHISIAYGWIEFPATAAEIPQLRVIVEDACRRAKECERHGGTVRLHDMVPKGHHSDLESSFQLHSIPFDCGGDDPIDSTQWAGWWRPGRRYPTIYEIASSGEQFVPLDDLRALVELRSDDELHKALSKLIAKHDSTPPTPLLAAY